MANVKHLELPDGTILDLAGSSGAPSVIEKLYTGNATSGTITLDKSLDDFDEFIFYMNWQSSDGDNGMDSKIHPTKYLLESMEMGNTISLTGYDNRYVAFKVTSKTTFEIVVANQQSLRYIYGIKYGNSSGGSSTHKYSTEEKVVGEWIDGKPIYEKTFNFESIKLDNINLDVSDLNIEYLIDGKSFLRENIEGETIKVVGPDERVTASTEGTWNGYTHFGYRLFNGYGGSEQDCWGVIGVGPDSVNWVKFHYNSPIIPNKALIQLHYHPTVSGIIEFQFSNDDINYETLATINATDYSSVNIGEPMYIELNNPDKKTYKYFKFNVIGNISTENGFITADYVQIFQKVFIKKVFNNFICIENTIVTDALEEKTLTDNLTIQYTKTTD